MQGCRLDGLACMWYSDCSLCIAALPRPAHSPLLQDWPEKKSKLVVDIATNPKLHDALAGLQKQTEIQKVNIKLPEVDLSKNMPAGKDVVSASTPCGSRTECGGSVHITVQPGRTISTTAVTANALESEGP